MTDVERLANIKQELLGQGTPQEQDLLWLFETYIPGLQGTIHGMIHKINAIGDQNRKRWQYEHDYLPYEEDDRR